MIWTRSGDLSNIEKQLMTNVAKAKGLSMAKLGLRSRNFTNLAKLKTAGKSAGEIAASKPFADLDATWGKGFFNGDVFAQVVYSAL